MDGSLFVVVILIGEGAIVIQEIDEEDWGFAGMLTDEWRAARRGDG